MSELRKGFVVFKPMLNLSLLQFATRTLWQQDNTANQSPRRDLTGTQVFMVLNGRKYKVYNMTYSTFLYLQNLQYDMLFILFLYPPYKFKIYNML